MRDNRIRVTRLIIGLFLSFVMLPLAFIYAQPLAVIPIFAGVFCFYSIIKAFE